MSMETKIIALAQAIGADVKLLTANQGDLASLPTTAKDNLVNAITEIHAAATADVIDDSGTHTDGTVVTWSIDKIESELLAAQNAVKDELINGAGAALDTLKELADALGNDPNFAQTIATGLNNRVRFDQSQTLTAAQMLTACTNIGVGDPTHDFAADYTAAKTAV